MGVYQERAIRVFVSSTFQDMKEERDELVKRVFPRLRKLCEQRGVTWGEVDLRWGITDEAKAEGQVLPLCLAEIHRCRPYFIGLLGERYGWVPLPQEIPPDLLNLEPWLQEHQHKSVTELEILHGVLNDPAMAELAFFYFRDPAYISSLSPEQQTECREEPTEEELAELGPEEAARRAEARRAKLAALKESIRQSFRDGRLKNQVRENYPDPQALGEWVYQDLKEVIERLFPEEEVPDALARERLEHEAFARSRTVTEVRPGVFQGVYLGRPEYFQKLDEHARGDGLPLVVLGESGVGKSALLANWAFRFQQQHPEELLVLHFIGATAVSTDWLAMLRRIMGELKERFEIPEEIPDKPDDLRLAFANWLHMAAARGRVVLILDALNQLEDKYGAPDLVWLPPVIPDNIRLILSTLPGRPLEEFERRVWLQNQLTVEPLTPAERRAFIPPYLKQYGKELSPKLEARVADAPQSANPLYLRTLLEELRVYGDYHTLEERLTHYLEAPSVEGLYERVLARWEEDCERDRPGLVREAMTLIWAARRGLSEAELLELLGTDGQPLPHAHWSPFYLAADASLVNRGGLLGFFHAYLRKAVENRYLSDPDGQPDTEAKKATHLRLADYFNDMDIGPRKVDELPWHLQKTSQWKWLHDCLTDLEIFENIYDREITYYDLFKYWQELELQGYDIAVAYKIAVGELEKSNPPTEKISIILRKVSFFLGIQGRDEIAISLMTRALDYKKKELGESSSELVYYLNDLGQLYCSNGEFYKAELNYRRALNILKTTEINNNLDIAMIMDNLGVNCLGINNFKEAEQLLQQALTIREKFLGPYDVFVARSLNNLGGLYKKQGKFYKAESFFLRSYEITRKIYGHEHPQVCGVLVNLAAVYWDQGKYEQTEANYRRSLEINLKFFGNNHKIVAKDLNNLAKVYHVQGKYEEAKQHYESSLAILKPDYPLYKIVKREYEQMLIDEKTIRLSGIFPFLSVPFKGLSNFLSRLFCTHTVLEIDYQNPESNEVDIKISDIFPSVTSLRKKFSTYVRRLLFRRR